MEKQDFYEWFKEMLDYANSKDWYVDTENPNDYKDSYEQGLTPEETIDDDMSDAYGDFDD